MDLINKLKTKTGKPKKINILVVRVSSSGELRDSKPCAKCINYMLVMARKKGYIVNRINYSTNEGTIISTKLSYLAAEPVKHICRGLEACRRKKS